MHKLRLKNLIALLIVFCITPACKKGKGSVVQSKAQAAQPLSEKSISVFDDELDAFDMDENSPFGQQDAGFVVVNEADEHDMMADQSRHGFMPIYFEFDADTMKPGQFGALENNLARAKKLIAQGKKIVIEGHACKFGGSAEHNMHLSQDRARKVHAYFVKNGIPATHITTVGRGNEMCVVQHGTKDQQAPNRRVEFIAVEKSSI